MMLCFSTLELLLIFAMLQVGAATALVPNTVTYMSDHPSVSYALSEIKTSSASVKVNMDTTTTTVNALLAFKQAMLTNDPANVLAHMWNSSVHYCAWHGVRCSNGTHHVTALLLDSNQFNGSLPSQLSQLPHLAYLNVSNNSFSGPIPSELGRLSSLTHLDLSHNHLSGTIPSSLANCTSLQYLDCRTNSLSGKLSPFLASLNGLLYLDLSENSFHGEPLPSEIGRLSNIQFFQLINSGLVGRLPPSVTNCTNLVWLHLEENSLTGTLPFDWSSLSKALQIHLQFNFFSGSIPASFGNCTSLLQLDLSNNSLTGELPDSLGNLAVVQYLVFFHNRISGSIPTSLMNCTGLKSLQLAHNNLTGSIPSGIGQLKQMLWLSVTANTRLSGGIPHSIGDCAQLQELSLSSTELRGPLPASVYNLTSLTMLYLYSSGLSGSLSEDVQNLTALRDLRLSFNTFHGKLPAGLGALEELQWLALQNNHFEGPIPWLWRSIALGHLDLSFNFLTGAIPAALGQFRHLDSLYLQNNRLSEDIPANVFRSLPGLLNLDLSHNKFTGPIPQSLYVSVSLDLSFNNLTGLIPRSMGNMLMVTTIRLAGNRLTGGVTDTLSACQSLETLDLSVNSLGGEIPSTLRSLVVLQYLNLSHNNLSGDLPQSLGGLRDLVSLDVSYNALQGTIPSIGVYQNLSAADFMGNAGLCGYPLHKTCMSHSHHSTRRWTKIVMVPICTTAGVLMIWVCACVCWPRCSFLPSNTSQTEECQLEMQNLELRKWTARELYVATNGFDEGNIIGSGGDSVCFRAKVEAEGTKKLVAVKKRSMISENRRQDQRNFVQELKTLCKVRHRNLVSLLGYCMDGGVVALVLEFMERGNLDARLHGEPQSVSWGERLSIAADVAEGLVYLHHESLQPIIHCDIKPANILLGADMVAKISDFGIAKFLDCEEIVHHFSTRNFRGTFGYAAPECATDTRISTKADVYSFGVLLLELLTGMRPTSPQLQAWGLDIRTWTKEMLQDIRHNVKIEVASLSLSDVNGALQQDIANDPLISQQFEELLDLGIKCTTDMPQARPTMRYVRETLVKFTKPKPVSRPWPNIEAFLH